MALLVAVALSGAGAIVYAIESRQLAESIQAEVGQELDEFRSFSASRPPAGVPVVLHDFLASNVPDDCEVLVTWHHGSPDEFLSGSGIAKSEARDLLADGSFRRLVARVVDSGSSARTERASYGELLVSAQPVRHGDEQGALVVVSYLDQERAGLLETMRTYALVALLSLLLITGLAGWQSGRLLAPLRTLRETTDEIGETDLARRLPEVGNDDITALTRTFNQMLARLEAAFVDQRQFLDDAGHELRTPLTVLRGHLELLDHDDPDDVEQTRRLLLDELDRMSRLVGDLILLAKHDRPDFLDPTAVSLERLTHSLLAKARGLADRDWQLASAGDGVVHLDEQRVTQAVLQLADNAVKHTEAGDAIAIGSMLTENRVLLWVADSGPGIPPMERSRVFERFGRGTTHDGDDGFGLGLSIVRAIAEAHGGTVSVADVPADVAASGALFTLDLPREPSWPGS